MRLLTLAYMFSLANKTLLLEKKKKNPHAHALGMMEKNHAAMTTFTHLV